MASRAARWYCKHLGGRLAPDIESMRMQENFVRLYAGADHAGNPALFCRADRENRSLMVFFSPDATALAQAVDAAPCKKPEPGPTLILLIGDAQAWSVHFGVARQDRGETAHDAPACAARRA